MSIKIENTQVFGWDGAIRGARNPMNSWDKSDSIFYIYTEVARDLSGNFYGSEEDELNLPNWCVPFYKCGLNDNNMLMMEALCLIGPNDHKLLMNLCKGGTEEAKWRRMVHVQMDITAPLYWWKEFETYKVGTVSNSCSTMHKIQAKEFTLEDFSCEHLSGIDIGQGVGAPHQNLKNTIRMLNECRDLFIATKDKDYWWQMIQLLPSSYNQRRTIDLNYEVLASQYRQRKGHKLDEWRKYCNWIETLPYSEFITMGENA